MLLFQSLRAKFGLPMEDRGSGWSSSHVHLHRIRFVPLEKLLSNRLRANLRRQRRGARSAQHRSVKAISFLPKQRRVDAFSFFSDPILATYCGSSPPPPVETHANSAILMFHSDGLDQRQRTGFIVRVNASVDGEW